MLEDVIGVATQASRLMQLAQENGIELNWRLLAMMGASWTIVEAARRSGKGGACLALQAVSAAWKWWTTEKPLSVEEQALLDCLASGIYDANDDTLTGSDGETVACVDGRRLTILVGDQDVTGVVSDRLERKVLGLIAGHRKQVNDRKREAARASLVKLTRKVPGAPGLPQASVAAWKAAVEKAVADAASRKS